MTLPHDAADIAALDLPAKKLEQANRIIRVLSCAYTDTSGHPATEATAFALRVAGELITEAQEIIEAAISAPPSNGAAARSDSHPPPAAA